MSAATVLMVVGLVVALVGIGLVVRVRSQVAHVGATLSSGEAIDGFDDVLERAQTAYRATDASLRTGVLVAVAGLLLAVVGAYLGSDARSLGTDIGGSGSSDKARVGGTW